MIKYQECFDFIEDQIKKDKELKMTNLDKKDWATFLYNKCSQFNLSIKECWQNRYKIIFKSQIIQECNDD